MITRCAEGMDCVERVNRATSGVRYFSVFGVQSRNELIVREEDAVRKYPLYDAIYDTTSLTDATGTIEERFRYSGFGQVTHMDDSFNVIPVSNWYWLFHGEELDQETGWYNYGYRYYLPRLGRWPSRDPLGELDGFNLYAFVKNGAIGSFDILGLHCIDCWKAYSDCNMYADQFYATLVENIRRLMDEVEKRNAEATDRCYAGCDNDTQWDPTGILRGACRALCASRAGLMESQAATLRAGMMIGAMIRLRIMKEECKEKFQDCLQSWGYDDTTGCPCLEQRLV